MILLAILNILDIIAGITLIIDINFLLWPLGAFHVVKGGWTVFTSFKQGWYLELLGGIDLLGGLALILAFYNLFPTVFIILGILMVAKGVFCFMAR